MITEAEPASKLYHVAVNGQKEIFQTSQMSHNSY